MSDCVFCSIVSGELPKELVFEDEQVIAFHDHQPAAPVHILVIPRQHTASLEEADDALRVALLAAATKLGSTHSPEHGYRIAVHGGKQVEVPHLHIQILGGAPSLGSVAQPSTKEVSAT